MLNGLRYLTEVMETGLPLRGAIPGLMCYTYTYEVFHHKNVIIVIVLW